MGKRNRDLCNFLFFIKATLAILLGSSALGYQGYLVYREHRNAQIYALPPVTFPDIGTPEAASCFYNAASGLARLEPPQGSFFFGFSPLWINGELPADIVRRSGFNAPLYNSFVSVTPTSFSAEIIEWNCQLVGKLQAVLELSVIPEMRADEIPASFYPKFALHLRNMNSKYGVPILLRFMPEMNGFWMQYGQQPTGIVAAWRLLAQNIRAQTNMTALLWSPNIGASYQSVRRGNPSVSDGDFLAMDTDNDGVLGISDNPFDPYYPGDDVVDWIGISNYNYNRDRTTRLVIPNQPDVFTATSGTSTLFNPAYPFYPKYVTEKGKPFIFSETAAPVEYNIPGNATYVRNPPTLEQELQVKQAWWNAILKSSVEAAPDTALSKLKAAVWFEESKPEKAFDADIFVQKDFAISTKPEIARAFAADIQALGNKITYPSGFSFSCAGEFKIAGLSSISKVNVVKVK